MTGYFNIDAPVEELTEATYVVEGLADDIARAAGALRDQIDTVVQMALHYSPPTSEEVGIRPIGVAMVTMNDWLLSDLQSALNALNVMRHSIET